MNKTINSIIQLFFKKSSCNCGNPCCERKVKTTSEGRIYAENHFCCGEVQKIIKDHKNIKL